MLALVVVVHDQQVLLDQLAAALRQAGHDVAPFIDPMKALLTFDTSQQIKVLVTDVQFPLGKPNGISLARMARAKRPSIRIIFLASPEFEEYAEGLGLFMPMPVNVSDVVDTIAFLDTGG